MAEAISFIPSEEQTMLRSTLAEFLSSTIDYEAVRDMSTTTAAIDRAVWSGLCDMGLVGLHIPETHGGGGYSMLDIAVVFEELGRFVAPVPLLSTVMASTALMSGGSDDLCQRVLPAIASGDDIATLAVYETSHAGALDVGSATLVGGDDGYVLNGTKRFVTDAPNATVFVVAATRDGNPALAVVRADTEGVSVAGSPALDATRPLGEVSFADVAVSADDVIANGAPALSRALDVGVVCLAAEQVGGLQWCLDTSVEYAKNRFQFGRAIGSFQAIKHRCADMLVRVEHARSVAWFAAATIDDTTEAAIAVPLAKSVCSDAFVTAAGDTIQILGGIGFTWEHEAHLYFKRAKADSLLFGSVETHRDRLAESVGF